jgi:hypothetical protein
MDVEQIRSLRLAWPFKPFYLVLKDGRRLLVDQPYHLAIAPDGSHMIVSPSGSNTQRLTMNVIDNVEDAPHQPV